MLMLVLSVRPPLLPNMSSSQRTLLSSPQGELSSCNDLSHTAPVDVSTTISEGLSVAIYSNHSLSSMVKPYSSYVTSSSNEFPLSSTEGSCVSSKSVRSSFMSGFEEYLIPCTQQVQFSMSNNAGSTKMPYFERSSLMPICDESTCISPSGESTENFILEESYVPQSSDESTVKSSLAKSTSPLTQDCHLMLQSRESSLHPSTINSSLITSPGIFTLIPPIKKFSLCNELCFRVLLDLLLCVFLLFFVFLLFLLLLQTILILFLKNILY
ncbi:unnamed protein product [Meganyctiphanes norvegica]|uniref:Uncharacterized protein n=1 Tax=Meganyctiphanes norvegica TaxID=48144 RepID=A0AAV2RWE3_MEGNR